MKRLQPVEPISFIVELNPLTAALVRLRRIIDIVKAGVARESSGRRKGGHFP